MHGEDGPPQGMQQSMFERFVLNLDALTAGACLGVGLGGLLGYVRQVWSGIHIRLNVGCSRCLSS